MLTEPNCRRIGKPTVLVLKNSPLDELEQRRGLKWRFFFFFIEYSLQVIYDWNEVPTGERGVDCEEWVCFSSQSCLRPPKKFGKTNIMRKFFSKKLCSFGKTFRNLVQFYVDLGVNRHSKVLDILRISKMLHLSVSAPSHSSTHILRP